MYRSNKGVVYGVGINDSPCPVRETKTTAGKTVEVWGCPFYKVWVQMLYRCYSSAYKRKYTHNYESTVCQDWLTFTNFKSWMEKQDWAGKQLDKDILIPGNREYSPRACAFVDQHLNKFFNLRRNVEKKTLIGATKQRGSRYSACITRGGLTVSLGGYETEQDAHFAWLSEKIVDLSAFIVDNDTPLDNRLIEIRESMLRKLENREIFYSF